MFRRLKTLSSKLKIQIPVPIQIFESWVKMLEDIAKAALVSILGYVILGNDPVKSKVFVSIVLSGIAYIFLLIALYLRNHVSKYTVSEGNE